MDILVDPLFEVVFLHDHQEAQQARASRLLVQFSSSHLFVHHSVI